MSLEEKINQCVKLIAQSKSIAILTGAGVSTAAGIPDFRGPKGLYVTLQYDPDVIFDVNYFYKDPKPFYQFAKDFLTLESKIKPTFAHIFFAQLEAQGKLKGVITQNIDSLHQLAGSKNVYEMHGSFWKSLCLKCRQEYSFEEMKSKIQNEEVAHCKCGGVIKPDIVFFGENVKYYQESIKLAESVDLFFVVGTSCVVYPAASIPQFVRGQIVIINQTKVNLSAYNIALSVKEEIDSFLKQVSSLI